MTALFKHLLSQFLLFFQNVVLFLKGSPLSSAFLVFMVFSLALCVAKQIIIYQVKKQIASNFPCSSLKPLNGTQYCSDSKYSSYFEENNHSCQGCIGRNSNIESTQVQSYISGSPIKKTVVILSDIVFLILPYASFIYSLFSAVLAQGNIQT